MLETGARQDSTYSNSKQEMDTFAYKQDIHNTPNQMSTENVKMEFKLMPMKNVKKEPELSDCTNNTKQELLSTFKSDVKEDRINENGGS